MNESKKMPVKPTKTVNDGNPSSPVPKKKQVPPKFPVKVPVKMSPNRSVMDDDDDLTLPSYGRTALNTIPKDTDEPVPVAAPKKMVAKPVTDREKPLERDRKPVADRERPLERERKPVSDREKPLERERKPVAGRERPPERERKPVSDREKPPVRERKPVADRERSVERERKPVSPPVSHPVSPPISPQSLPTVEHLPPRTRRIWNPETREYVPLEKAKWEHVPPELRYLLTYSSPQSPPVSEDVATSPSVEKYREKIPRKPRRNEMEEPVRMAIPPRKPRHEEMEKPEVPPRKSRHEEIEKSEVPPRKPRREEMEEPERMAILPRKPRREEIEEPVRTAIPPRKPRREEIEEPVRMAIPPRKPRREEIEEPVRTAIPPRKPRSGRSFVEPSELADAETSADDIHDGGFGQMGLSDTTLSALRAARYHSPTPIQAGVLPRVLAGKDVMGQAHTGTGKTAAFLVPLIEMAEECDPGDNPIALILVPTRELAVQVKDEAVKLSLGRDLRITACYGGKPIVKQLEKLQQGIDIVIGTPGRLLDLMSRRALSCKDLRWVVLDEADRMLDIGFRPDIEKILRQTPSNRQTLLFSATLAAPVVRLAQRYMKEPETLDFSDTGIAVDTIEQFYITVDHERKFDALVYLLERESPKQAIIFCRTKRGADRLARLMSHRMDSIAAIHGDLIQTTRDKVMTQFRAGTLRYLVATDVVGRGIDVSGISHIVNYDIPSFCDDYVHRVGRTGRMGREGVAFTFVTAQEGAELTRIEMRINRQLQRSELKGFEAFSKPTDLTVQNPNGEAKPVYGKLVRKVRRAL